MRSLCGQPDSCGDKGCNFASYLSLFQRLYSWVLLIFLYKNRTPQSLHTTPPGCLTAHERFCLVLLCSQPDTVHRFPLRKTEFHHCSNSENVRLILVYLFPEDLSRVLGRFIFRLRQKYCVISLLDRSRERSLRGGIESRGC